MRDFEEVGRLNSSFGERAQEAYRCYASLYLDFADDNMNHFRYRDIDIAPLEKRDVEVGDSDGAYQAYMESAAGIAETALKDYYGGDREKLFTDYPPLKEYMEGAESRENSVHEFYKQSDGFFTYYVNRSTGEKKFRLEEGDVEVEAESDDFVRA